MSDSGTFKYSGPGKVPSPTPRSAPFKSSEGMAGEKDKDDYLIGGDERLRVPRRSEPRTSVPAGAVGLAGEFSAVYPRQSPGGWQIIGHTDAVLWDIDRPDPALLTQGRWVRFRAH